MTWETEKVLQQILDRIYRKVDNSRKAELMIDPLVYYISTGRCTGRFVQVFNRLSSRQMTTIANRLVKAGAFGDYAERYATVTEYLGEV